MIAALSSGGSVAQTSGLSNLFAQTAFEGKWVFVGALVLVLVWLIVMPRRLVHHAGQRPPLWRNVRMWAIVICVLQIWIYWYFG